jgi:hypothetical protein
MFSNHATHRNQQRCIPPIVHDWLTRYGTEQYDGHGGCRVFFTKLSIKKMEIELGKRFVRENKKYLDVYRVESTSDGTVITCGRKSKRFKH